MYFNKIWVRKEVKAGKVKMRWNFRQIGIRFLGQKLGLPMKKRKNRIQWWDLKYLIVRSCRIPPPLLSLLHRYLLIFELTFQHFDADVGCSIWSCAYLTEFPYLVTSSGSQFLSNSLAKLEFVKYICGTCGCNVPGLMEPKLYSLASIEVKPAPP